MTDYLDSWFSRNNRVSFQKFLVDCYYDCLNFIKVLELYDDNYVTYYDKTSKDLKVKLFCVDPSSLLKEAFGRGRSAVLFSATLAPLGYFTRMLEEAATHPL